MKAQLGTKEFNDSAMEMFGGKPKQRTAVEWLEEDFLKLDDHNYQITQWLLEKIQQAKEMENQQQGYSLEDLKDAYQSGFTNGFDINSVTFNEWFEQFKNK